MSDKKDLLVEIGTEELPPKALATLSEAFSQGIDTQLTQLGLQRDTIQSFATPRRLAVLVEGLASVQAGLLRDSPDPVVLKSPNWRKLKPRKAPG
jgi:glycyl-tRNA synthetase beta chain